MYNLDTQEQAEIRASVRKVAEARIPHYQNETYYNTVPRPLFSELAELGLAGIAVEEKYGGIAATPWTSALIMEELAAVDLGPAIFTSVHAMVCGIIGRAGSTAQKDEYLPKLASGKWLGAFALTEPNAGSDAGAMRTVARITGDDFILNGTKCYISSAGWADVYVVFARTNDTNSEGISAFIVDAKTPGLIISSPEKKMGCELSPISSLTFEDMRLPKSALLGTLHRGYATALAGLSGGRISIASCANGVARSAFDKALAHLKEREQFGEKLISFQGLQFMLADMKMKLEASRLLTWQACRELEQDAKSAQSKIASSIAKCFSTDSAMNISTDAVQLLGGAGYIKDYAVERLMREAKMLQIVEGTNQIQRMVIARELAK
jgi:alkylation response protein AidB-like acyl-CoA dehydrogenase